MADKSPVEESWRLLTIAFIDLVGSTPLSLQLDGDDYDEVITSYWGAVMPIIKQHGGFPATEEGDGRLVWFGWPQVTISDAERAVRMALDVRDAVRKLALRYRDRLGINLSVRLGVHTGEIIVRTQGDDPPTLIGATANVAAKVQGASPPDSVCISASSAALLGSRFILRPNGSLSISGLEGELAIFQVEEEQAEEPANVEFVGRHEELDVLRRYWQRVVGGEAAVVLLVGEAGIGKSQLAGSFLQHDTGIEPLLVVQGDSYRQDQSWGAVRKALSESSLSDTTVLLDRLSGARGREEFMAAAIKDVERVAMERATTVLVEDGHWLDHSSAEFVSRLIGSEIPGLFVLATSRLTATALEPVGTMHTIALGPLSAADLRVVVDGIAPSLEEQMVAQIVDRAGGNPLFAEVLAAAAVEPTPRDTHPALLPHSEVPIVVQQALRTQLEASQSAANVSSTAAVIGMEFTADLVRTSHPPKVDVDTELAWLESAGVIRPVEPLGSYRFRHALVHQLAYDLLVRSSRRLRHARVADSLKEAGTVGSAVLGMHFEKAGRYEQAAEAKVRAAVEARAVGAFREGVDLVNQVLDLLERGERIARRDLEIEALELRSVLTAAFHRSGYVAGELDRDRLTTLLEPNADDEKMVGVLTRDWAGSIVMSDLRTAGATLRQMSHLAKDDPISSVMTRQFRGTNMLYRGNFAYAEPMLRSSATSLAELGLQPEFRANWSTAIDPVSVALSRLPPMLWVRGEFAEAEAMRQLAEAEAATIAGPAVATSMAHVKANSALFYEQIGNGEKALALGQEIVDIGREPALAFWEQIGGLHQLLGSVIVEPDDDQVDSLLDAARRLESSARLFAPMVYLRAAQGFLELGRSDKALVAADGAQLIAADTGARWLWPETQRLRAQAVADDQKAISLLQEAAAVANRQGARIYEVRALLDLLDRYSTADLPSSPYIERSAALLKEFPETSAYAETGELADRLR